MFSFKSNFSENETYKAFYSCKMINLGLIGSREFVDYRVFKAAVLKVLEEWNIQLRQISHIVSGGSKGADTLAERFADEFNIRKEIYPVTKEAYALYGKSAPLRRNHLIVQNSTHLIAFPSHKGAGTQHSINIAKEKGIPMKILFID